MDRLEWITLRILPGIVISCILLTGCDKGIFYRSEEFVIEKIDLEPFNTIHVKGVFEIELRNSPLYSLELKGSNKILEKISCKVDGDTLELSDNNSFKWLPDYPVAKLTISLPDLNVVNIYEPSNIYTLDTLCVTNLYIVSWERFAEINLVLNAANIFISTGTDNFDNFILGGNTWNLDIRVYGSVRVDARNLVTQNARVRNSSTGGCLVNVKNQLRVWLGHTGNIYYLGDPVEVIVERQSSSGQLIKLNNTPCTIQ